MIGIVLSWLITGAGDPSVMLAQGTIESRFDATAVSRVGTSRFCGVFQTAAKSERECKAMQSPLVAVIAYRRELAAWKAYCHGVLRCALDGYGSGISGAKNGTSYSGRVMRLAHRFELARIHGQVAKLRARVGS